MFFNLIISYYQMYEIIKNIELYRDNMTKKSFELNIRYVFSICK